MYLYVVTRLGPIPDVQDHPHGYSSGKSEHRMEFEFRFLGMIFILGEWSTFLLSGSYTQDEVGRGISRLDPLRSSSQVWHEGEFRGMSEPPWRRSDVEFLYRYIGVDRTWFINGHWPLRWSAHIFCANVDRLVWNNVEWHHLKLSGMTLYRRDRPKLFRSGFVPNNVSCTILYRVGGWLSRLSSKHCNNMIRHIGF